jgi:hypothetical protein
MKNILLCIILLSFGSFNFLRSQTIFDNAAPGINYQMVVRDESGDPLSNSAIVLTISFKGGSGNTIQYSETHSLNTDEFGLVNVVLGNGSPVSPYTASTFDNLNWVQHPMSMDVNLSSGGNFFLGNFALQAVPYSFFSEEAKHAVDANFATSAGSVTMGLNALTDVTISNPQNNQTLMYTGGQWVNVSPFWVQSNPGVMSNSASYNTRIALTNLSNQAHTPAGLLSVNFESANTNSVQEVAALATHSTGTPTAGLGSGLSFYVESDNGASATVAQIAGLYEDNQVNVGAFQVSVRGNDGNLNRHLKLTSAGNLSIGTPNPNANLHLHGNSFGIAEFLMTNDYTGANSTGGLRMLLNDNDFSIQNKESGKFTLGTNNNPQIFMQANGFVGIGIPSPSAHLHLSTDSGVPIFQISDPNSGSGINDGLKMFMNNGEAYLLNYENADINLGTNLSDQQIVLKPSGQIGFNTNNPNAVVHAHSTTSSVSFRLTSNNSGQTATDGLLMSLAAGAVNINNFENGYINIGSGQNSEQLCIAANGGVGIGNLSPAQSKFEVTGSIGATTAIFRNNPTTSAGVGLITDWPAIGFNTYYNAGYKSMGNSGFASYIGGDQSSGGLIFAVSTSTINTANSTVSIPEKMRLTKEGNLGINTSTPGSDISIGQDELVSNGGGIRFINPQNINNYWSHGFGSGGDYDVYYNSTLLAYVSDQNGAWIQVSDRSKKKDVTYFNGNVLDKVKLLRPASYHYTHNNSNDAKSVGFIAQEVEEVFPELVYDKDGMKTLNYSDFGVISIAAVQELNVKVEQQADEIEALKKELELLKSLILEGKK